jgi:hypothetical protein
VRKLSPHELQTSRSTSRDSGHDQIVAQLRGQSGSGSRDALTRTDELAVCKAARPSCLSRQPTGAGPAVAGAPAGAKARRRGGGTCNAASLDLAAGCQPVLVTFSSRTSSCPLKVAELL